MRSSNVSMVCVCVCAWWKVGTEQQQRKKTRARSNMIKMFMLVLVSFILFFFIRSLRYQAFGLCSTNNINNVSYKFSLDGSVSLFVVVVVLSFCSSLVFALSLVPLHVSHHLLSIATLETKSRLNKIIEQRQTEYRCCRRRSRR